MEEYARNFMELCYPGIKNYSCGGPIIIWSKRIEQISFDQKNEEVLLFCIYRVTDLINDNWEIKAYTFFLIRQGSIYFITEETANYEQEVEIFDNQKFDFEFEEITLSYIVKNSGGFKQVVVPKSKWQEIKLILEITSIPEGDTAEEIRRQFLTEKFPINIKEGVRLPAFRDDECKCICIPKQDVIKELIKSSKINLIHSLPEQGDYVPFNHGCYSIK